MKIINSPLRLGCEAWMGSAATKHERKFMICTPPPLPGREVLTTMSSGDKWCRHLYNKCPFFLSCPPCPEDLPAPLVEL